MQIENDISYCVRQKVPFSADLPADLSIGKAICVTGTVLPKCSRFVFQIKFSFDEIILIRVRNLGDVNKHTWFAR